jgi:hypothetical protein
MSSRELSEALKQLRILLAHLPDIIPFSDDVYSFTNFSPDPEKVDLYGTNEAAVNNALEITFAKYGRDPGPCPFQLEAQGPGLVAVVGVLETYLIESPQSALLNKWVVDLTNAAKFQYSKAGKAVSNSAI